jgi:ribosomal protein L12E/L44/L45/RPP1/RPP2
MRLHEILTEEQLDELNRRDFLKQAGWAALSTSLAAAALDQGAHADEVEKDKDKDEDEDDEDEQ